LPLKLSILALSIGRPGLYPALSHNDWRGYKTICFEVFNPMNEPLSIVLRIDDKKDALEYNDRYNKTFALKPVPNQIKIPIKCLKT